MVNSPIPDLSKFASPPRRSIEKTELNITDEPIDAGGNGVVYEADLSDNVSPDRVAVKEPKTPGSLGRETIEQFHKEATTWETLDRHEREEPRWEGSEHIVGIVDVGDDLPWIAMEYMDGRNLQDRLTNRPDGLPLNEALWIGERICRGLELAHSYGVAHLDLKPANILLRESSDGNWDVPKIADWGLARLLVEESGSLEGLTVEYAAPEQFEPTEFGEPDTLTDVYQAGAIVYALLTGSPPYSGSRASIRNDVVYGDTVPLPSTLRSGLPKALDTTIQIALSRSKTDRYRNIGTFEEALRAIRTRGRLPAIVAQHTEHNETQPTTNTSNPTLTERQQQYTDDVLAESPSVRGQKNQSNIQGGEDIQGNEAYSKESQISIPLKWQLDLDGVPCHITGDNSSAYISTSNSSIYNIEYDNGSKRWHFQTDRWMTGDAWSLIAEDDIYVGASDDILYCLDPDHGRKKWHFQPDSRLAGVSPVPDISNSTLYFSDAVNYIYSVNRHNGSKRWRSELKHTYPDQLTVVGDNVIIVNINEHLLRSDSYNIRSLERNSGTEQWHFSSPDNISWNITKEAVYIGKDDGLFYSLDMDSGEEQWRFPAEGACELPPVVGDSTVYTRRNGNDVVALNSEDGTEKWQFQTDFIMNSPPEVVDGTVYIGCNNGRIYALDTRNGTERWQQQIDAAWTTSPVVAGNTVYVGSDDGHIRAFSTADGTEQWRFQTGTVEIVTVGAGGTIFVGSDDETLYAFAGQ